MRPLWIEVWGFLSYRERVFLNLQDLRAAVITGENGAGKTSFVEAIPWALFGKGRGRTPDEFVSAGLTTVRVAFAFELASGTYQVVRERSITSGGKSNLQLLVDTNGPDWSPMGGDSIAETQAMIEDLLGLDYETWEATSYVGQGRADEFTKRRPAERKAILAEVLGLAVYDQVAEKARAQERMFAGQQVSLQTQVEQFEDVLASEGEGLLAAEQAATKATAAKAECDQTEQRWSEATARFNQLRDEVAAVDALRQELGHARGVRLAEEQRHLEEVARFREDIRRMDAEAEDLGGQIAKLRSTSSMAQSLEGEAAVKSEEAVALEQTAAELANRAANRESDAAVALEKARTASDDLVKTKERIDLLSRSEEAICYACGQSLTPEHRETELGRLHEDYETFTRIGQEQQRLAQDNTRRAHDLRAESRTKLSEAIDLRAKVVALQRAAERAAADGERIEAATLQHRHLHERIDKTREQATAARDAAVEAAVIPEEEKAMEARLAAEDGKAALLSEVAAALEDLVSDLQRAREFHTACAVEQARAEEVLGRFQKARDEHKATMERLDEVATLRFRHASVAMLFGRDGIPALIVENAIPQIQDQANRLLKQFTDGRFSVALESQKATKAGALRETLQITVADGSDARPIEALSGSERQRVDLALRHGISRLLAHRAGRPIDTLILDEPFTAFDDGNLQRAIEVLHALTEEYRAVFVITHLPELADAFTQRIEVSRQGGTSHVELVAA